MIQKGKFCDASFYLTVVRVPLLHCEVFKCEDKWKELALSFLFFVSLGSRSLRYQENQNAFSAFTDSGIHWTKTNFVASTHVKAS